MNGINLVEFDVTKLNDYFNLSINSLKLWSTDQLMYLKSSDKVSSAFTPSPVNSHEHTLMNYVRDNPLFIYKIEFVDKWFFPHSNISFFSDRNNKTDKTEKITKTELTCIC